MDGRHFRNSAFSECVDDCLHVFVEPGNMSLSRGGVFVFALNSCRIISSVRHTTYWNGMIMTDDRSIRILRDHSVHNGGFEVFDLT